MKTSLKHIRIENPVSGCGYTSRNRAKRFVSQGRAAWTSQSSIRFVAQDHRHTSAQQSVDNTIRSYDRAAHSGIATYRELANLPLVAPGVLLGFGRRKGAGAGTFRAEPDRVTAR